MTANCNLPGSGKTSDMKWELALFIVATMGISIGCLMPAHWLPPLPHDKLLHFLAFGGLAMLAGRIADTGFELAAWSLGLFIAGLAIEGLQNWVPGRKFCWRDLAANTAGISVAVLGSRVVLGI